MDAGREAPIAQDALQRMARVYAIEKEFRGYPAEERLAVRQERSRPLVDKPHAWFVATSPRIMAGPATSDAMKYALKRCGGVTRFLYDGRIELDNNTAERAIRSEDPTSELQSLMRTSHAVSYWQKKKLH